MKLLPVAEARRRMLAEARPLSPETVALDDALGRVLAEDVTADGDLPPCDCAAMDGWAVVAAQTPGRLAVAGESAAGHPFQGTLTAGVVVRVSTGAALPAGCDTVVIQEDAGRDGDLVILPAAAPGRHIRAAGGDFRAGEVVLRAGLSLDPWRLSLAAAAGRAALRVVRAPRVAVLGMGEELVTPPARAGAHQIYDSNSPAIAALAASAGAVVTRSRPTRDRLDAVISALETAGGDLVVTIGGASVGDHDLVRRAAGELGLELKVASVDMRPGKPAFFGVLGDGRLLLGLPGNPASALVCAEVFLRPLLAALSGAEPGPHLRGAALEHALPANGGHELWMRARIAEVAGVRTVSAFKDQDSSRVSVFACTDALLRRPPGAEAAHEGDVVEVLLLPRG